MTYSQPHPFYFRHFAWTKTDRERERERKRERERDLCRPVYF